MPCHCPYLAFDYALFFYMPLLYKFCRLISSQIGFNLVISIFRKTPAALPWHILPLYMPCHQHLLFGSPVTRPEKNRQPDWTLTDQDCKLVRPMWTVTAVRSTVHLIFRIYKTTQKPAKTSLNQSFYYCYYSFNYKEIYFVELVTLQK